MMYRKKNKMVLILVVILLAITVGYAALFADLEIEGTTNLRKTTWDIHFENIEETSGGVTPNSTTSVNAAGNTVTFNIDLDTPGEFYEFTVDAVNEGTVNGMIESVTSTLNGGSISALPDCLSYSATYFDGTAIAPNHLLGANSQETYKIRVEFRSDVDEEDLPDSNQQLNLAFTVHYVQADSNAVKPVPDPVSFATDSWQTINRAAKTGNTSTYNVGDTKTVDMGTFGTHTLRIANTSTPSECSTTGFSQTACGFVLEFADIIAYAIMNSENTNVGGWQESSMRSYVNTDIYNALPEGLRDVIINTTVVSGHGGTAGEMNFISTDKLYLLSTHEVWEDVDGNPSGGIDYYDTAYNNTRQLDYYAGLNLTTSSYSGAIKQYNGSDYSWWCLRSSYSYTASGFYSVNGSGNSGTVNATVTNGMSPAFRLG